MSDAINSQVENREARRLDVAPHVAFPTRILLSLTLLATFVRAAHAQAQGSFGIGGGTAARRQRRGAIPDGGRKLGRDRRGLGRLAGARALVPRGRYLGGRARAPVRHLSLQSP